MDDFSIELDYHTPKHAKLRVTGVWMKGEDEYLIQCDNEFGMSFRFMSSSSIERGTVVRMYLEWEVCN